MAFKKIEKTGPVRHSNVKARFTISESHASGTLGITNAGWEFLKENNVHFAVNDKVDIFFDETNDSVAIKKVKNGEFQFTDYNKKTVKLSSKDLAQKVECETEYDMEISKEKEFDIILKVIRKITHEKKENTKNKKAF